VGNNKKTKNENAAGAPAALLLVLPAKDLVNLLLKNCKHITMIAGKKLYHTVYALHATNYF
jgi:hypothetical protein